MSDIKTRLTQIAESKGYSVRAFEEACKLKRGNISNILSGGAIGSDKLARIFDAFPDINPTWLISGSGEMFNASVGSQPLTQTQNTDMLNKLLEQAELIGELKARIKDLEQRLEKTAGDVCTGTTANVG